MASATFVLLILFAYLLGGVPFGLLYGRIFADVDIRSVGSGNIGATNVNRILGRKLGAATLLSDTLKAVCTCLLATLLLSNPYEIAFVGLMTVVGHCFPIYLKFQGGKGVATTFGVALVIAPLSGLVALGVWLISFRLSKLSAVGALASAISLPFLVYIEKDFGRALIFLGIVMMVVLRHRENIQRLRTGEELKP
ncbi:MAG: glycerol-3-phosphate 1-O-acyltransferase [Bradymonadales bacterium]|nr:MAG: glycerol-3-phosphate 1-O-acyltransferase [Bradymonadales bacterium]